VFVFQLTVGLYEFKVVVDGENAHGEGYVNVTVNPSEFSVSASFVNFLSLFSLLDWTLD